MQVKLIFRLQERPDEDLDVTAAFAENPGAVRDALCKAICVVGLDHKFQLLRIAGIFGSVLKKPWEVYKPLRPILEACRQRKYGHDTEQRFHENAGLEGVAALALIAKHENKLMDEIDALPYEESIELTELVKSFSKTAGMIEYIESFARSKRMLYCPCSPSANAPDRNHRSW
jgi:hypothetical protein